MTLLILSTFNTVYEHNPARGYTTEVTTFDIGDGEPFPVQRIECRTLQDVRAAVESYGNRAQAAQPNRSFKVYARPANGSRKMPGFDAAERSPDFLGTKRWVQTVTKGA